MARPSAVAVSMPCPTYLPAYRPVQRP